MEFLCTYKTYYKFYGFIENKNSLLTRCALKILSIAMLISGVIYSINLYSSPGQPRSISGVSGRVPPSECAEGVRGGGAESRTRISQWSLWTCCRDRGMYNNAQDTWKRACNFFCIVCAMLSLHFCVAPSDQTALYMLRSVTGACQLY